MLRNSSLLCSCGANFHSLSHYPHFIPPISPVIAYSSHKHPTVIRQSKRFAHVNTSHGLHPAGDFSWPTSTSFSPYDLFQLERHAPYSKRRYYELVKIYHPDRGCIDHPLCRDLPESIRLQRYRLLVAAHELLSDPAKRASYDKFGTGWQHRAELFGSQSAEAQTAASNSYSSRREQDPTIFRNATWEDWENWSHRSHGSYQKQQQSSPVSHETFATFFFLMALFGGVAQAIAIGKHTGFVEDRVKAANEKCSRLLDGRRHETLSQNDSVEARVQSFLMKRDPSGYGLNGEEEETYRHLLESQRSANIKQGIDSWKED
ncbi:hypothetical protein FQN57_003373 [Myotisia sp. PD_48]|nr:hypothetical protein FQN57_003373 [Myotisia sp. PD_48]